MKFVSLPRLSRRTVVATIGMIVLAVAVLGLVIFLGPDPGAEVRARYRAKRESQASQPTNDRDQPSEGKSADEISFSPPNPLPSADFESRPDQPGFLGLETGSAKEAVPPRQIQIPPPPPVPHSLLGSAIDPEPEPPHEPSMPHILPEALGRTLFSNTLNQTLTVSPIVVTTSTATLDPAKFAPISETICAAFIDTVITANTEVPVVAAVWEPFYSGGHKLLDVGDKLLGHAAPGKTRDRVNIAFDRIVFLADRRSTPFSAVAMSAEDGSQGVPGKVVGNLFLQSIFPVLLEMAAGFTSTLQQRILVGSSPPRDGFQSASGGIQTTPTLNNAVVGSGQSAVQKISDLLAQDIEENRPYVIVPAGTLCYVRLTSPLDVSSPDYGK